MFRKDFVAIALLLSAAQVSADPLLATQYGDFDRYVLALSWQTGFCQSMQDRNRSEPEECRLQQELSNKADFLTVHGLWPSLPKSIGRARGGRAPLDALWLCDPPCSQYAGSKSRAKMSGG